MSGKLMALMGAALLVVVIGNLFPGRAYAQCGTGPTGSRVNCHLDQDPVYDHGIWHGVHARKDCCTNCRSGKYSAAEKDAAHMGIISNPLEDVYTNCHACRKGYAHAGPDI
jgi:hypothetical protein